MTLLWVDYFLHVDATRCRCKPTVIEIFGREKAMLDVLGAKEGDISQDMPLPFGAAVINPCLYITIK